MNQLSPIEARVATLIAAYADQAPIDVDPMAVTQHAAASARRGRRWAWFAPTQRGLALGLLVVALQLALVAGALVAGSQLLGRDPEKIFVQRGFVEPFIGLPPEGATPSEPEIGELVFSFGGRVTSHGMDFHRMWVYADGRLIWKSNLEGSSEWRELAFGTTQPTTAVIEQRLAPEGVDLMRAEVMATARVLSPVDPNDDVSAWGRPGVLWGGMKVEIGSKVFDAVWADPDVPGRLANPAAWLPASAWADRRVGGYVPTRYAVCLEPNGGMGTMVRLPEPARSLLLANGADIAGSGTPGRDCSAVTTAVAREFSAALDDAGIARRSPGDHGLTYVIPGVAPGHELDIWILAIVPHGEVVCSCG